MRSRSLFVGKFWTPRVITLPRSTVTSPVAAVNGAGTSTSAVSPTSYLSLSATRAIVSSFVTCQLANSCPATHRYRADFATRPFESVASATRRSVPGFAGVNFTVASPLALVVALREVSRVSFGSLLYWRAPSGVCTLVVIHSRS